LIDRVVGADVDVVRRGDGGEPVVPLAGTVMTVLPSLSVKVRAEWLLIGRPSLLVSVMV
jgi:hypothetical protein